MTVQNIFKAFSNMFPDLAQASASYKKVGSKTISVKMKNGKSLVFLFNNEDDWTLGTKLWRRKPEPIPKGGTVKIPEHPVAENPTEEEVKEE